MQLMRYDSDLRNQDWHRRGMEKVLVKKYMKLMAYRMIAETGDSDLLSFTIRPDSCRIRPNRDRTGEIDLGGTLKRCPINLNRLLFIGIDGFYDTDDILRVTGSKVLAGVLYT